DYVYDSMMMTMTLHCTSDKYKSINGRHDSVYVNGDKGKELAFHSVKSTWNSLFEF
ncbi:hypothetical protein HMI54_008350, partial [Coelomomyces lativittatus]